MGGCEQGLRNPETRLERGVLTWREGPGALTQRRRCSGSSPLPLSSGCPLKPGGGFDLGSTRLSAGRARWTGGGAEEPTSPPALPSCGPLQPTWTWRLFPAVSGGTRVPPPPLPCSCSPAALPHPKDSWERGWGWGAGRSCSARAGTREGRDMKELGPAGVEGAGNPPAVASRRAPHIWATGTAAPRRWGGGRSAPDTQPFPARGVVTASPGKSRGPRRGCESCYLLVVSGLRHRVCLWVREVPECAPQCSVWKHPPPTPSPAGPVSWGDSSSFWAFSIPGLFGRWVTAVTTKPGTAGWLGTAGWG